MGPSKTVQSLQDSRLWRYSIFAVSVFEVLIIQGSFSWYFWRKKKHLLLNLHHDHNILNFLLSVPWKTGKFGFCHFFTLRQRLRHLRQSRVRVNEGADDGASQEADAVDDESGHGVEQGHEWRDLGLVTITLILCDCSEKLGCFSKQTKPILIVKQSSFLEQLPVKRWIWDQGSKTGKRRHRAQGCGPMSRGKQVWKFFLKNKFIFCRFWSSTTVEIHNCTRCLSEGFSTLFFILPLVKTYPAPKAACELKLKRKSCAIMTWLPKIVIPWT